MPNFVQLYKSTDANAPTLSGTAGSLIALLNAVLVNGYSTAVITSLTQTGNLATATLSVANATLVTGNYVTIAGADQSDYNGIFQITVLSSTSFTYQISNNPASPATTGSSLTYRKAPLQWASPFTTTNIATYRSADNSSNRFYLRIDETGSTAGGQKEVKATGYVTMSDHTAGTEQFPNSTMAGGGAPGTNGGVCWAKSITADGTLRAWSIIGDDRTFYLQVANGTNTFMYGFGHFIPTKPGDGYNTFLAGMSAFNTVASPTTCGIGTVSNTITMSPTIQSHLFIPRGLLQNPSPVSAGSFFFGIVNIVNLSALHSTGSTNQTTGPLPTMPNLADGAVYFDNLWIIEGSSPSVWLRGRLPGFYAPLHYALTSVSGSQLYGNFDQVAGVANLTNVTLTAMTMTGFSSTGSALHSGQGFFDTFGPWT